MALSEVVEVVGLPLAVMLVSTSFDPDKEIMLVRSGHMTSTAIRYTNRYLARAARMRKAGWAA